ncbi:MULTISPECIES: lipid asymmetry maintenance protein MlaB [Dickeya]|uniref:MlaFEDCB phospholipid ABC transporter maintains OM lipid asymmetry n=1 Tax=Dickeya aquatica TaxID=1401087 RepID=A0A375A6E7_9GAMM|nr:MULTISPECIES: lipid asymmetry maintenance protein MlaB [Dickeya]SLM61496.1 MlaFEDCB phospholipid ABC transporter; maintains OM lipid asymmetry [Dickeya aquatica]
MADALRWRQQNNTLSLEGTLDRHTLLPLWQQRTALLKDCHSLDVSGVEHVDSAGLALLVHVYHQQTQQGATLAITGVSDRLRTLVQLYNLGEIIPIQLAE